MNFKVRCVEAHEDFTTLGKIYIVEDGKITFDNGHYSSKYSDVLALNQKCYSQFELVTDRPHICEILGVEVGEKFDIVNSRFNPYVVSEKGEILDKTRKSLGLCDAPSLIDAINHPEKIIRQPQFSEDEKGLMRLYVGTGFSWFARDKSGGIEAYEVEPDKEPIRFVQNDWDDEHTKLLSKFLPQITWQNSPFDAKTYLEGLK